jgi:predicted O-methyltransferase YrrM
MNDEQGIHNQSRSKRIPASKNELSLGARLDSIEQALQRAVDVLSGNVEALFSIFSIIHLRYPLPPMGRWAISPDFARILVDVILERTPRLVVELGSGVSTLLCAYCLEKNGSGSIVSVEHEDAFARATAENIRKHCLDQFARVVHAPLRDIKRRNRIYRWYDKSFLRHEIASQKVDVLIVDGPPAKTGDEARYPAIPLLFDRLADQAIVLVDDAGRPEERATVRRWVRKFPMLNLEYLRWTEKGTAILKKGS